MFNILWPASIYLEKYDKDHATVSRNYLVFSSIFVNLSTIITLLWASLLLGLAELQPMFSPVLTWIDQGSLMVVRGESVSGNIFIIVYIVLGCIVNNLFLWNKIKDKGGDSRKWNWLAFYLFDAIKYGFFAVLIATSSGISSPIQLSNMIIISVTAYFFILNRIQMYEGYHIRNGAEDNNSREMSLRIKVIGFLVWLFNAVNSIVIASTQSIDAKRACYLGATIPNIIFLGAITFMEVMRWEDNKQSVINRFNFMRNMVKRKLSEEEAKNIVNGELYGNEWIPKTIIILDLLFTLSSLLYSTIHSSGACSDISCSP